jgi:prepilin-type N-terminal cleavage/methylation domain-containing protein
MTIRPFMMRQTGFTLIELLIALALSALISLALVVAFRLGIQFLEKGRGFYEDLQETLAVLAHARRTIEAVPAASLRGDATRLTLSKQGGGLICLTQDDGNITLASWKPAAPPANTPPPAMPVPTTGMKPEPKTADDSTPIEMKTTVLLDALTACQFEYLAASPPGGLTTTSTVPAADSPPPPYRWQADFRKGTLASVRLTLANRSMVLPPVVMTPGH